MKIEQAQRQEFEIVYNMLKENPRNYLGYKKLGEFYQKNNINQAFLCYEQAWGICNDMEERKMLEDQMRFCRKDENFQVHPASFVILSYDAKEMMIDCLESIRRGCVPGSYEIVVVDNNSQDGIRDYLVEQKDIVLQLNDHNTSFAAGCNQGVKLANPYNDIFLLNNDTIVPVLALFYMRLALYEADDIASVGPILNVAVDFQLAPGNFNSREEWLSNAVNVHLPSLNSIENKVWLVATALLIRRSAWDLVGNLDEQFIRGNCEDTEYGFRLLTAGYRNVLCHNAFIYHYGSVSMKKDIVAYGKSLLENGQKLNVKLGFNPNRYNNCYEGLVNMAGASKDDRISVLEIGCGLGATISKVKYQYPNAEVVGIEENRIISELGKPIARIVCADVEKDTLPFEKESFDIIFLTDVINRFENAGKALSIVKSYLKESGKIILMTRNLLYGSVFVQILKGKFETVRDQDERIRHFYTMGEILGLISDSGLISRFILKITSALQLPEEDQQLLTAIKAIPGAQIGEEFNVVSYIITATLS